MRTLINVFLLTFPLVVTAATPVMYVSDRVPVNLHGANDATAPVVKQIVSGAPVQVLERDGALFKVRAEDGGVGWIDPSLLSNEKPLQLLYAELRDRYNNLREELKTSPDKNTAPVATPRDENKLIADLRAELKGSNERVAELERVAHENITHLNDATARATALENENAALKNRTGDTPTAQSNPTDGGELTPPGTLATNNKKNSIALPWFLASSFLVLLLGGAIGAYAVDWYIRKRHGGFRIY